MPFSCWSDMQMQWWKAVPQRLGAAFEFHWKPEICMIRADSRSCLQVFPKIVPQRTGLGNALWNVPAFSLIILSVSLWGGSLHVSCTEQKLTPSLDLYLHKHRQRPEARLPSQVLSGNGCHIDQRHCNVNSNTPLLTVQVQYSTCQAQVPDLFNSNWSTQNGVRHSKIKCFQKPKRQKNFF